MAHNSSSRDPKKTPLVCRLRDASSDLHYHTEVWASGGRGGGKVPSDFGWPTAPKQHQEERGAAGAPSLTLAETPGGRSAR